jgi:diguanylate cyclase (GGDEF)-like protein
MRFLRGTCAWGALVLVCAATGAGESWTRPTSLRTLTIAREAHDLSQKEAARSYPIHLRAMVTYYDPYIDSRHTALFVQDASGCIFVKLPSRPILPLSAGDEVDVVGVSAVGDYAPVVLPAKVQLIRHSHLPANAIKATMTELLSGSMDSQWVELEGVVHSVQLTPWNATFDIASLDGPISATTLRDKSINYDAFVNSLVRIHGNAAPVFNRKYQKVGIHILFPSLQQLTVLEAAPEDPYAMPALSVTELLQFMPKPELDRRVRVRGEVTLHWPGRMICIQQGRDGLCVQTTQSSPVSLGNMVDIIGFPAIGAYKVTLDHGRFRLVDVSAEPITPKAITVDQAFIGDHDGELVQMEGVLIGQNRATDSLALVMRSGKTLFPAILPQELMTSGAPSWKEGSILRLTGICSVKINSETTNQGEGGIRAETVQILLRSPGDIQVVQEPSWWTGRHALETLTAVALVAFSAFAWIFVLRHRVEQQTKALRASEERLRHLSEHDALTNLPNRILLNDRLTMALQRAERFEESLGLLMVDVDRFKEVNDLYGHPVGDKILCELAKRLSHSVRLTDTVARIGGDEFLILLPDLHAREEAESIAAKIVAAVSSPFLIGSAPLPLPITVSVGVCTYPDAGLDMEKLLQHVDDAMYSIKASGRNGFKVYKPERCDDC